MNILVTNDDGINSAGIYALVMALKEIANVIVMAPLGEQSAVGHALTVSLPLRVTDFHKEGDFFGYIALLEENTYKDTAQAMESAEVMLIPKTDFIQLVNSNPEISNKFIKLLANNVSERETQLVKLAYNSLRKRVADALLLVNKRYKKNDNDNPQIQISREDLANIVGTATESLIRTLSDFRGEKLIEIQEGKILIKNESKLAGLVN